MRIAVTIKSTTFHKGYGGLETQNKLLCEGLAKKGYSVTVFAPQNGLEFDKKTENGVDYVFLPVKTRRFSTLYRFSKKNWQHQLVSAFAQEHTKEPFKLLISQSSSGLPVIREKIRFGIKVISITHGSKIGEFQTKWNTISGFKDLVAVLIDVPHVMLNFFTAQRSFIHGSDKIVAVSKYVKNALIDETYVDEKKVVVINNGVDASRFDADGCKWPDEGKDKVTLLSVGQVTKQKGILSMVQMLQDKDMEYFRLDVAGTGPDLDAARELAAAARLTDRITFHGKLSYEEVLKLYSPQRCDIFVMPSTRKEGFPMVLAEAMHGCLPVVAYNAGGISDAVVDGETGFLVPVGDLKQFKDKVWDLGINYDKRKKLGENARIKALNEFSLDKMIENYEKVISEVLK